MTKLELGTKYRAKARRGGTNSVGEWELLICSDENDRNEITVFVRNGPSGMPNNGGEFIIEKFYSVTHKKRKSNDGTKWYECVQADCDIKYCHPDKGFEGELEDIPAPDFASMPLPRDDGADPWADVSTQEKLPWDDVF